MEWTVTNDGPADADVSIFLQVDKRLTVLSVSAPQGWNGRFGDSTEFWAVRAGPARLARGGSVTVAVRLRLPNDAWPGTTFYTVSPFSPHAFAEFTVGAAPIPSTPSQLFAIGGNATVSSAPAPSDAAYDPASGLYLVSGVVPASPQNLRSIVVTTTNGGGVNVGSQLVLETDADGTNPPSGPRLAYSEAITGGAAPGGVMLVWSRRQPGSIAQVFARPVATQGLTAGARGTISEGASDALNPSIAYSATSRTFLVVWESASRILARRVAIDGRPVGTVLDVGTALTPSAARPQVAWNSVTDEFGVIWNGGFARVSAGGVLLSRLGHLLSSASVAVNSATGNYIVVSGGLSAEISRTGRVTSRGVVAQTTMRGIAFNAQSGTFLVAGEFARLELNAHGAALSRAVTVGDCRISVVVSRPDLAEWRLFGSNTSSNDLCSEGVGTFSRNGGSDGRLGGCISPDPFEAIGGGHCYDFGWLPPGLEPPGVPSPVIVGQPLPPPPPPPVPGGCTAPDPFVALGGGTCVGGGWYPPGMLPLLAPPPPPPPPPVPGGCTAPDPFVALGGGTCFNGGWYPPGMLPAVAAASGG